MNIVQDYLDAQKLFNSIYQMSELCLNEPRFGCEAVAEVLGNWLRNQMVVTGRIWAFHKVENESFHAPLMRHDGTPLPMIFTDRNDTTRGILEDASTPMKWEYHVDVIAETAHGEPCVYSPALFNGVVSKEQWQSIFTDPNVVFVTTDWSQAPRYGHEGSPYHPMKLSAFEQEFDIADAKKAQIKMDAIRKLCPTPVQYRKHTASGENFHLKPRWGNGIRADHPFRAHAVNHHAP